MSRRGLLRMGLFVAGCSVAGCGGEDTKVVTVSSSAKGGAGRLGKMKEKADEAAAKNKQQPAKR